MGEALPYREPSPDAVRAGAWFMDIPGKAELLPEWLPYWDISQKLQVKRHIEVDLDKVIVDTRLPSETDLSIVVLLASDFEDEGCAVTLASGGGVQHADLEVDLDGRFLGSAVQLVTSLVLDKPIDQVHGPVAWRRGSILWQDSKRVRLYGDSSQFPVMEVDFADFGLDPGSPWFVQIGSDLELPVMGSILLLVNERFPLVTEAAREMSADRAELAAIRSALFADIGRVLVEFALSQEDLAQDWPEDSLGEVLSGISDRFPQSIDELRTLRVHDPTKWAAQLASTFGLFKEPLQ